MKYFPKEDRDLLFFYCAVFLFLPLRVSASPQRIFFIHTPLPGIIVRFAFPLPPLSPSVPRFPPQNQTMFPLPVW